MILKELTPRELVIDERELSARLSSPGTAVLRDRDKLYDALTLAAKPVYLAERVKIKAEDGKISLGHLTSQSVALSKFLDGADECFLLVATLGIGVDRLILKASQKSASEGFITDALSDALIEALCDRAQSQLSHGYASADRVSPGYADLELSMGEDIIKTLDAERLLGIKMTECGMMIPRKSVSAIVALRKGEGRVK